MCRLTFQVGDVLPALIRACVARPGPAKCGSAKHHKGLKARLVFCGTRAAYWRRSANRLLNDVGCFFIFFQPQN